MITKEKLEHHKAHLEDQHNDLHKRIEVAEIENARDDLVQNMKKKKLALKDEIEKLEKQIQELDNEA